MKVQSTFYIDFISKTVDVLLISSFITKQMPKLLIFDAFTLLICKKNVAIYALLRCKIFSLKIWVCKIFDKFHVCNIQVWIREMDLVKCRNRWTCCVILGGSVRGKDVFEQSKLNKKTQSIHHIVAYRRCEFCHMGGNETSDLLFLSDPSPIIGNACQ